LTDIHNVKTSVNTGSSSGNKTILPEAGFANDKFAGKKRPALSGSFFVGFWWFFALFAHTPILDHSANPLLAA
jgi:hypothetical protein